MAEMKKRGLRQNGKKAKSRFGPPNQLKIMNLMIDCDKLNKCLLFLGWRNK